MDASITITLGGALAVLGGLVGVGGFVIAWVRARRERVRHRDVKRGDHAAREALQEKRISDNESGLKKHLDDCVEARRENTAALKDLRDEMKAGFDKVFERFQRVDTRIDNIRK